MKAKHFPVSWVAGRWSPDTLIRPLYTRLPMGSTHAVFILVVLNRLGVAYVSKMFKQSVHIHYMSDLDTLRQRLILSGSNVAVYAHVDDFLVLARLGELACSSY